ncbi:MAG: Fic family protein [Acidobacteria bacterium]|nr:Fic family protein [Acidobacteriota bacterium]
MSDWKPISPLLPVERTIDISGIQPLYDNWRSAKTRLKESGVAQLEEFTRRLTRRLSIETGILERLYDLDRGTTEALVAHGFKEDLISHESTNLEPAQLIDILRDQEAAVQLVMDCVARQRPLTKGVMHELHAILTRHQDFTSAIDPLGIRRDIPLLKGKFKEQPNNPKRPDGTIHHYSPPLQVESEVENLLAWLPQYAEVDPIIVAAWFHHRFTQIHPYQDGNGRVARALTTLLLLRADLLPLVVDRDLRVEYIQSLEDADGGNLSQLVEIFARLERNAILQALSVDAQAEISHQKTLTSAVIGSLAEKFAHRRLRKLADLRQVNKVAISFRSKARVLIEDALRAMQLTLQEVGKTQINTKEGGSDSKTGHWYKFEVIQTAKESGKFANFAENHYFVKGTVKVEAERLTFVVSFHHIGRDLTGIMEATAFSKIESYGDPEDQESMSERFALCSVEPFVFTHQTTLESVSTTFERWLDAALAVAIKEFGDRL